MRAVVAAFVGFLHGACGAGGSSLDDARNPDTPEDASDIATHCGVTAGATLQRCEVNPLVVGTRPAVDGRLEWTQADPTVLYDADAKLWKAWWSTVVYAQCDQIPIDREIHIKYAESDDGIEWRIQPEPALRSHRDPGDWDYSTAETPTVMQVPGASPERRFALVYAGGNDVALKILGQTGWQLGVAFSPDGKQFTRISSTESPYSGKPTPFARIEGLALLASDVFPGVANVDRGIVADPELLYRGGLYHLYFSSVAVDTNGAYIPDTFGISHATSSDLVHWTAQPGNPLIIGGGQPAILEESGGLTMYFGQDTDADKATVPNALFPTLGFWRATSSDGVSWTRASGTRDLAWLATDTREDIGLLPGAAVVRDTDGLVRLFYSAFGTRTPPAGACAYVYDRSVMPPQIETVPGAHHLLLAIRTSY
jgi:hypothetical protein